MFVVMIVVSRADAQHRKEERAPTLKMTEVKIT